VRDFCDAAERLQAIQNTALTALESSR
jgi:hypothetical protein